LGVSTVTITVWLLFFVILVSAISKRWELPQPLLLLVTGIFLSFSPAFRNFHLNSATFFALFIPPLLFVEGWRIPKRELFRNRYSVIFLGFGLVFATVAGVGYAVHWLIPAIPLAAAIALGAVISPTDTVALSSVLDRVALPKRLIYILGGESLINDAAGLVSFKFAIAAVAMGSFSWSVATRSFLWIALGGILVGLAISFNVQWLKRLFIWRGIEDPTIQTSLSLITPYFAYMAAEALSVSGILAVVTVGLLSGTYDARDLSGSLRIHASNVWFMVTFVLEGFVFLMLGLQLIQVFSDISSIPPLRLAGYGLFVSLTTLLVRMLWVFPFSRISWVLNRLHGYNLTPPSWSSVFLAGWLGVRGAVTLAAALSIPVSLHGQPFPGRELIIFLAGTVILISMVTPILTLKPLTRWFNIADDKTEETEERMARIEANKGAKAYLEKTMKDESSSIRKELMSRLLGEYGLRLKELEEQKSGEENVRKVFEEDEKIRLEAIAQEKQVLHQLRSFRKIDDQTLRKILLDLDFVEAALSRRRSPEHNL
jgi:CPA1 family monovalent cation:H+ antiporter